MKKFDPAIKQAVLNLLESRGCYGKSKAMTSKQIAIWIGTTDRNVRRAVSLLRIDENLIASTAEDGFFFPATELEAKECLDQLKSRIIEQNKSYRGLLQAYNNKYGGDRQQIPLELKEIA